ncbi:hypothetical protein LCGC14_3084050 [marine sediment metagenome]|uniref:Uncharacterized protein n=1 Tax=marine sediment metagenome TaxID=412755 RepID=A0A0F8X125_9ZZZZ
MPICPDKDCQGELEENVSFHYKCLKCGQNWVNTEYFIKWLGKRY